MVVGLLLLSLLSCGAGGEEEDAGSAETDMDDVAGVADDCALGDEVEVASCRGK